MRHFAVDVVVVDSKIIIVSAHSMRRCRGCRNAQYSSSSDAGRSGQYLDFDNCPQFDYELTRQSLWWTRLPESAAWPEPPQR